MYRSRLSATANAVTSSTASGAIRVRAAASARVAGRSGFVSLRGGGEGGQRAVG